LANGLEECDLYCHFCCRYTGRNIAHYFNAALSLASQATEEELNASENRQVRLDRTASRKLPTSYEGLPDYLALGNIHKSDKWRPSGHNMEDFEDFYDNYAMVYFGSRKLFTAIHEHSLKGEGAHLEGFLSSVAMKEGMKSVAIPMPQHEEFGNDYYSCCTEAARTILPDGTTKPILA